MIAAANAFCFGEFECYEGRDSYTVVKANIKNYFRELANEPLLAAYGFYFLELANYYTRENVDETQMLKLLYQSLRALLSKSLDNTLVRRIFEMKTMVINGEYPVVESKDGYDEATIYTLSYIVHSSIEKLYTFTVKEYVFREMESIIDGFMNKVIDRPLQSLDFLKMMEG